MTTNPNRALLGALIQQDAQGVLAALHSKADPNSAFNGIRPLHIATIAGSRHMLELLFGNGASPNVTDKLGRTALHYAAIGSADADPGLVDILIEAGADVNARDANGCTPLDLAAGAENQASAAALIASGAECREDRKSWVHSVSGGASGRSSDRGRSG